MEAWTQPGEVGKASTGTGRCGARGGGGGGGGGGGTGCF